MKALLGAPVPLALGAENTGGATPGVEGISLGGAASANEKEREDSDEGAERPKDVKGEGSGAGGDGISAGSGAFSTLALLPKIEGAFSGAGATRDDLAKAGTA